MCTNMINLNTACIWNSLYIIETRYILIIWLLVIRDLVWKAIGLYKAWQKNDLTWFIFIFIFNTCGILPIIYLILNNKKK